MLSTVLEKFYAIVADVCYLTITFEIQTNLIYKVLAFFEERLKTQIVVINLPLFLQSLNIFVDFDDNLDVPDDVIVEVEIEPIYIDEILVLCPFNFKLLNFSVDYFGF